MRQLNRDRRGSLQSRCGGFALNNIWRPAEVACAPVGRRPFVGAPHGCGLGGNRSSVDGRDCGEDRSACQRSIVHIRDNPDPHASGVIIEMEPVDDASGEPPPPLLAMAVAGVLLLAVLAGLLVQLVFSTHEDEDSFAFSAAAIAVVVAGLVRVVAAAQRRRQFIYKRREAALDMAASFSHAPEREARLLGAERDLIATGAFDDAAVIAEARRHLTDRRPTVDDES
jgi:hypothetical protein